MDFSKYLPMEDSYDDQRFGPVTIYYNPDDEKDIICIKTRQLSNREEFDHKLQIAQERLRFSSPYILKMLYVQPNEEELTINICFEYPNEDLVVRSPLLKSPNEILKLMHDILCGMAYLEKHKMIHGNIRPEFIYFNSREGNYILLDRLGDFLTPNQIQHENIFNGFYLYIDPVLFTNLCHNNLYFNHNLFKSEIFSFGIVIISMILYDEGESEQLSIQELYDREMGNFNEPRFLVILENIKRSYFQTAESEIIFDFICYCLLNVDASQRLGPYKAFKMLKETLWKVGKPSQNVLMNKNKENDNATQQTYNDFTVSIDNRSYEEQSQVSMSELKSDIIQDMEIFNHASMQQLKPMGGIVHEFNNQSLQNEIPTYVPPDQTVPIVYKEHPITDSNPHKVLASTNEELVNDPQTENLDQQQDLFRSMGDNNNFFNQDNNEQAEPLDAKNFHPSFSLKSENNYVIDTNQNNFFLASASSQLDNDYSKNELYSQNQQDKPKNVFFDDIASASYFNFNDLQQSSNPQQNGYSNLNEPNDKHFVDPIQNSNILFTFVAPVTPHTGLRNKNNSDTKNDDTILSPSLKRLNSNFLAEAEVQSDHNLVKFNSNKNSKYYSNENKVNQQSSFKDMKFFDNDINVQSNIQDEYSAIKYDSLYQNDNINAFQTSQTQIQPVPNNRITSEHSSNLNSERIDGFFGIPTKENNEPDLSQAQIKNTNDPQLPSKDFNPPSENIISAKETENQNQRIAVEETEGKLVEETPIPVQLVENISEKKVLNSSSEYNKLLDEVPKIFIRYAHLNSLPEQTDHCNQMDKQTIEPCKPEAQNLPPKEEMEKSELTKISQQEIIKDFSNRSLNMHGGQNLNELHEKLDLNPNNKGDILKQDIHVAHQQNEAKKNTHAINISMLHSDIKENEVLTPSIKNYLVSKNSEDEKIEPDFSKNPSTNSDQLSNSNFNNKGGHIVYDSVRFEISDKTISKIEKTDNKMDFSKTAMLSEIQMFERERKRQSAQSIPGFISQGNVEEIKKHNSLPANVMKDNKLIDKLYQMSQIVEEIDNENPANVDYSNLKKPNEAPLTIKSDNQPDVDNYQLQWKTKNDVKIESASLKHLYSNILPDPSSKVSIKIPELHEYNEMRSTNHIESLPTPHYNKSIGSHYNDYDIQITRKISRGNLPDLMTQVQNNEIKVAPVSETDNIEAGIPEKSKRPSLYKNNTQLLQENKKSDTIHHNFNGNDNIQKSKDHAIKIQNPTETVKVQNFVSSSIQQHQPLVVISKQELVNKEKTANDQMKLMSEINRNLNEAQYVKNSYFVNNSSTQTAFVRTVSKTPDRTYQNIQENKISNQINYNIPPSSKLAEYNLPNRVPNTKTIPAFKDIPISTNGKIIINKADFGMESMKDNLPDFKRANTPNLRPRLESKGSIILQPQIYSTQWTSDKNSHQSNINGYTQNFQNYSNNDPHLSSQNLDMQSLHNLNNGSKTSIDNPFKMPYSVNNQFNGIDTKPLPISHFQSETHHHKPVPINGVHYVAYSSNTDSKIKNDAQANEYFAYNKWISDHTYEYNVPKNISQPSVSIKTSSNQQLNRNVSSINVQRQNMPYIHSNIDANKAKPLHTNLENVPNTGNKLTKLPIKQNNDIPNEVSGTDEPNKRIIRRQSTNTGPQTVIQGKPLLNVTDHNPQGQQQIWYNAKPENLNLSIKTMAEPNNNIDPNKFKKSGRKPSVIQVHSTPQNIVQPNGINPIKHNMVSARSRTPMKLTDDFAPQHLIRKADGTINILHKSSTISRTS